MLDPRRLTPLVLVAAVGALALPSAAGARRSAPPTAKLAGTVWTDGDADGVRERGEPGRAGVTVTVERRTRRRGGTGWVRVAAPRTGRGGAWSVTIRTAGRHRVTVRRPADAPGFAPRDKGGDRTDSDVDASGVRTLARLPLDGRARRVDAGLLPPPRAGPPSPGPTQPPAPPPGPSRASGIVWRDTGDGIRDIGDRRVENATIEAWNADRTELLASTRTNVFGAWELTVNATGPYRVRVYSAISPGVARPFQGGDATLDSDFLRLGADRSWTAPLAAGVDHPDVGAAVTTAPVIGDLVWNDADRDGAQDRSESGVAGVTVELWDDARSELYGTAVTDADGRYRITAPGSGQSFRLHVVAPLGAVFSPKDVGTEAADSDVNPSGPDAGWTDAFFLDSLTLSTQSWDAGLRPGP